jgi:transcription antitermination factor NusG
MPLHHLTMPHFPETLFEESPPPDVETPWWVIHTKPRAEKTLAEDLLRRSTPFFLPLYLRPFRHRGQALASQIPLFPGYLFLRGNNQEVLQALKTRCVVRAIPVSDQRKLHDDLVRLHRLIASGVPMTPEGRLLPGMLVEITSGPLQGLRGKIIRERGHSRFVVEIDFLCRGASCVLDAWTLQPLSDPALMVDAAADGLQGVGTR